MHTLQRTGAAHTGASWWVDWSKRYVRCVYVYACVYKCMWVCVYMWVHCIYMSVHEHACNSVHVYVCMYVHELIRMWICRCTCVYMCVKFLFRFFFPSMLLKDISLWLSFLMLFLMGYQGNADFIEELGRISSSSIFWKSLCRIGIISLLNVW